MVIRTHSERIMRRVKIRKRDSSISTAGAGNARVYHSEFRNSCSIIGGRTDNTYILLFGLSL